MRILIATGGTSNAPAALRLGAYIANRVGQVPTILTVIRQPADYPSAQTIIAEARQFLEPLLPEVYSRVRLGYPPEEIIREAIEGEYDLVIAGAKQHHDLMSRFLIGSTAERVMEHAPCPVIITRGKSDEIRRILLCDSGIEDPSLIHRFVTQLGAMISGQEEFTILHVMSQISAGPGVAGDQLRADADELIHNHAPEGELLERDLHMLEQLGVQAEPKIRHGLVVEEIWKETRSVNYDLVVIGAHRGEGWRRILLDDLAHRIISQVDRPIAVVR
jgi:nucleotide-binding universal stress UspA family protein